MKTDSISEETRLRILRVLEQNPELSQRELAKSLGVSLGKVNYCLKALVEVGWVKAGNFVRSSNKVKYVYVLTPVGVKQKAALTINFLELKQRQFDSLRKEIDQLEQEVKNKRLKNFGGTKPSTKF